MRIIDMLDLVDNIVFGGCRNKEELEKFATLREGKEYRDFVRAFNAGHHAACQKGTLDYKVWVPFLEPVIELKPVQATSLLEERYTYF